MGAEGFDVLAERLVVFDSSVRGSVHRGAVAATDGVHPAIGDHFGGLPGVVEDQHGVGEREVIGTVVVDPEDGDGR